MIVGPVDTGFWVVSIMIIILKIDLAVPHQVVKEMKKRRSHIHSALQTDIFQQILGQNSKKEPTKFQFLSI